MEKRTALVFGATGLVGKLLAEELCRSDRYDYVKIFVRRKSDYVTNEKITEILTDFENLDNYSGMISGDDLFICLGTTIKKAGSVKRMEEVDRDLPVKIVSIALGNSVGRVAVVSSVGADPSSSNYYLRIKGEMESELMKLNPPTLIILRPSLLLGNRSEKRTGEAISKVIMQLLGIFMIGRLSRYKGVRAEDVAGAMLKAINYVPGTHILESEKIKKISRNS